MFDNGPTPSHSNRCHRLTTMGGFKTKLSTMFSDVVEFCNSTLKPNIGKLDFHTHPMCRWSSHPNILHGIAFYKCVCGGEKRE